MTDIIIYLSPEHSLCFLILLSDTAIADYQIQQLRHRFSNTKIGYLCRFSKKQSYSCTFHSSTVPVLEEKFTPIL